MSNDSSAAIVSKVPPLPKLRRTGWNYPPSLCELRRTGAHVLKNAGVGYGDYVEQITYLLFLKLADEMTELGFDPPSPKGYGRARNPIPDAFAWSELSSKSSNNDNSKI
ncbi:MAG: type I restriction-modification system subunit M N-terminal domain-containing protein [Verrucomicrobiales bacterium]|nr:type I restriction-modification system subunit M N-terminal domain-containing protein [Verrucomicrobiales bacterium]